MRHTFERHGFHMALYMRTGKPTKADLIRGILDYWDPCKKRESAGYMYYNYEAETIAQTIRKKQQGVECCKAGYGID